MVSLFSLFTPKNPDEEMRKAQVLFEKIIASEADSRESRSLRLRMGLLCRAHLDKSFVAGAEQMASWQELAALAIANGKEKPPPPEPSVFQKIKAGDNEMYVYLPEDYAHEAYFLGWRYQRAEIPAIKVIETMQGLANQLCYYELKLSEPFQVLQFLRDELAQSPDNGGPSTDALQA
jgi:hypothetical protein